MATQIMSDTTDGTCTKSMQGSTACCARSRPPTHTVRLAVNHLLWATIPYYIYPDTNLRTQQQGKIRLKSKWYEYL